MPVTFVFWISISTKVAIATRKNMSSVYTFVEPITYTITPEGGGVGT